MPTLYAEAIAAARFPDRTNQRRFWGAAVAGIISPEWWGLTDGLPRQVSFQLSKPLHLSHLPPRNKKPTSSLVLALHLTLYLRLHIQFPLLSPTAAGGVRGTSVRYHKLTKAPLQRLSRTSSTLFTVYSSLQYPYRNRLH